ncbi:hypothetical protein MHC_01960 [Mycoplasma haemocanis str. Illinois]|uniref:Uncharacterized protein n=1 Tax=Mycoplasma haemocanis (strain Illinois) TaxID=1111676 RepID=H6N6I6_MYCHN|nr:hypothetical protein [Mycoplasma haemocanis]AEW45258.1 hypothetical protein MHC_01960 [Mycoplasma haemocanis str. Illinois]
MNPSMIKLVYAFGSISAIGGGVFTIKYIYDKSSSISIESHLKYKNLTLISSLNSASQWDEEYKLDKDAIKAVIKVANDSEGGTKLKEWCSQQLSKPFKESEDLSKIERWCTVGKISQRIPKGKELLNNESETSEWEKIYNKNVDQSERNKIALSNSKGDGTKDNDLSTIKKFCSDNKDKPFLADKKTTEYDLVNLWCIKQ